MFQHTLSRDVWRFRVNFQNCEIAKHHWHQLTPLRSDRSRGRRDRHHPQAPPRHPFHRAFPRRSRGSGWEGKALQEQEVQLGLHESFRDEADNGVAFLELGRPCASLLHSVGGRFRQLPFDANTLLIDTAEDGLRTGRSRITEESCTDIDTHLMIRPSFIQALLDKLSHPFLLFANLDLKVLREHAHAILEGTIKFLACISEELRVGDADVWDGFFINAGRTKVDMRGCIQQDYAALQDSVAMRFSDVRMESWITFTKSAKGIVLMKSSILGKASSANVLSAMPRG